MGLTWKSKDRKQTKIITGDADEEQEANHVIRLQSKLDQSSLLS